MRRTVVIGMAGMVVVAGGLSIARAQAHRVEQARRSSLVQRGPVSPEHRPGVERGEAVARSGGLPQYPLAFRTIDGSGNNVGHPDWGASATPMRRVMGADYADGVSAPAGPSRPSPRLISNTVAAPISASSLGSVSWPIWFTSGARARAAIASPISRSAGEGPPHRMTRM